MAVLEKIFKVFTIYGHGSHLGHMTWTRYLYFPLLPGGCIRNSTEIGPVVLEKSFRNADIKLTSDHWQRSPNEA